MPGKGSNAKSATVIVHRARDDKARHAAKAFDTGSKRSCPSYDPGHRFVSQRDRSPPKTHDDDLGDPDGCMQCGISACSVRVHGTEAALNIRVQRMKMYILIKDSVPLGIAMVSAAHASLAAYLAFKDRETLADWLAGPFRKVICKVSEADFERAKAHPDFVVITESTRDHEEIALAFCPREEWPRSFRYYPLYR